MNNLVEQIYLRNYGSETFYKRSYCENLNYTEGLIDFQKTLNAFWVVDEVIRFLPKVIKTYNETEDGFYVITINIQKNNKAVFEIFREGYQNGKYDEHITVLKTKIPEADLPYYNYRFYLILSNLKPLIFTLMLTSEY